VFTPSVVKFRAQIVIDNNMRGPLNFEKVDYGASLFDKQLFTDSFNGMKETRAHGRETVTLPFQISMKDIMAQDVALLAEGKLRVTFFGSVYPDVQSGLVPVRFQSTIEIPIPKPPLLSFEGTRGSIVGKQFTVLVGVKNTNDFPISVNQVDSYLEMNGQQYSLLQSEQVSSIEPGRMGTVRLTMENSVGKTLSLALNALQSQKVDFTLGGSVTCGTPYGWVYLPVAIKGTAQ
jgi:xanthosine utilization system XapX-like protein